MEDHITFLTTSCARALYALRILRSHGMKGCDLQTVFQATVISKLQYASPAWWGFTNVSQKNRLESFLRRSIKAGFYSQTSATFSRICEIADKHFFTKVASNNEHILHSLLPPKVVKYHDTRSTNSYSLPDKQNCLYEKNFFVRMIYDL